MTKLTSWSPKKRLAWAVAAVVLVVCGAAAIWVVSRPHASHNDCATVEGLGRQWVEMSKSITALENGPGERQDLLAIADKESSMSDSIRGAVGSVSNPALKDQLGKWAQGTALLANSQRNSANGPPQPNSSQSGDADYYRAAVMTREATASLLQSCPNMPRVSPAS